MNMKNKILSFLLAIVMILTMVPALTVSAAEPVDLIHNTDGSLKEGVYPTYFGGEYGASTAAWKVINNDVSDTWCSAWSPGGYAWAQINLPAATQWTNVTITATYTDNYRVAFDVLASNDPTFATSTLLAQKAGGYGKSVEERKLVIDDAQKLSTPYRYLRVITTSSGKRFGVSEIDITGYEPTLPATTGLTELTQKPDVYAKVLTEDANTYKAQQVLDNDTTTAYTVTGGTTPELMVDLRRESGIKMIEFTPASGDDDFRKNYEIHTSNSPTFADYSVVYKNINKATANGAAVRAYMPDNLSARYVRIKSDSADLGVSEFKVWGSEGTFTLENMTDPTLVSATSGANPEYTADNDVATVWKNAEEATNASITYELSGTNPVTSIMLMPDNSEANRKNFNVYGSVSGDFTDAELIKAVGATPLALGQYEIITLEEPKVYKKIKIESSEAPTAAETLAFREVKILYNSQDAEVKVVSTVPANGATGVTNFGNNPATLTNLIEVELNRNIVASSINPTNVVIKDITDGEGVVLNTWTPYEISGKKFSIDISKLSSDKTYEVTLTTNILTTVGALPEEQKFTFTTGNIIAIPYDPDKVLVSILPGKYITGNGHSSYPLDRILDGNDSNFMITSGAPKIKIDLGNLYDIVAVQIVPRAGDPDNTIPNLNILGSTTDIDYTAAVDTLIEKVIATYPATNVGAKTFILDNPVNMRYLGIYRTSTYLGLGEIRAYAYVDKNTVDFGAWKVNNSTATTEFAAAGTYTFSTAVNNLSEDDTSYYMTVFAYNEDGQMVQKANEVKAIVSGSQTISSEVTLDADGFANATRITAVIYKAQNNAKMVVDAKTITKTGADLTGPAAVSERDAVKLEYTATSANERVALQVLGPKADGAGYDFDEIGDVAFNTELCYSVGTKALAQGEKATFYFKVPDATDFGEYSIRMTVTKQNGATTKYDSYLLYLSDANISECIEEFKAFPGTLTSRQLIDKWSDNLSAGRKFFKMADVPSVLSTSIPARFDAMFEYLCDLYVADNKLNTMADLVDLINAAYVMAMYEAENADAVKDALTKYAGDINGLYARKDATTQKEIINVDRYLNVYTALKSNVTDAATLKNVMQWTIPLSLIQGGTRRDVETAMEKYSLVLAYDASYATSKNVTLAQVAMKIDVTNAASYYNSFATVFKTAVDDVVGDPEIITPPDSYIPPVSTGGVGAHGARPAEPAKSEEKPTTPEVTEKPEEPAVEKAAFNDIENISWAKDYINVLYKEGIISGDGDGAFHPERLVTREEFLKMLIEALKIDVASKESTEFEDCAPDAWYYPYVQIASTNKITKGITRKTFGIGQSITRQDMAVLLSKALAIKNVTAIESDFVFDDVADISEYAQSDVSKMYSIGMISGMGDGTFAPKAYTTRAQAAVIIGRALEILGGASK